MKRFNLKEHVIALLNRPDVDFKEIARQTGLNAKTLKRIAARENDALHGTLELVAACFDKERAEV